MYPLHKVDSVIQLLIFIQSLSCCLSLPPTDHSIPAIHHFPLILYHDPWWMQTNGSDFLSVLSLLASILYFSSTSIHLDHICESLFSPAVHLNIMSNTTPLILSFFVLHLLAYPTPPCTSIPLTLLSYLFSTSSYFQPDPRCLAINITDGQWESSPCHAAHCHIIFAGGL